MKSKFVLSAKAFVTVGLLIYLIRSLDFILLSQYIANLQLELFAAVIAVHFLSIVPVEAYRLYIAFPFKHAKLSEFAGLALFNAFFRNFLPSNLGASVYTIIYLQRHIPSNVELVARMFLLRILGLFSLLSLVLTYLLFDFTSFLKIFHVEINYTVFTYVLVIISTVFALGFVFQKTKIIGVVLGYLKHTQSILRRVSFKEVSGLVLWSVAFHLVRGAAFWLLAYSLGIEITWGVAIFLLSANAILLLLPISIGGIGVQEGFLIFGLVGFGVLAEPAGALVFLYRILLLIMGLIGGVAYFVNLKVRPM